MVKIYFWWKIILNFFFVFLHSKAFTISLIAFACTQLDFFTFYKFEVCFLGKRVSNQQEFFTPSFSTPTSCPGKIFGHNSKIFFQKHSNLAKKNFRFWKKELVGFVALTRGFQICNQILSPMIDVAGILSTDRRTDRQTDMGILISWFFL